MDQDKYFEAIVMLRRVLGEETVLQVIHPGAVWAASFSWITPVSKEAIQSVEKRLKKRLPKEYALFLTTISDGATLYYDERYGQWGYKIYSSTEVIAKQEEWEGLFINSWSHGYFAIGETIDEVHPIIMNSENPLDDRSPGVLIEGNPYDPPEIWKKMANSLNEWLDRLVTTQGAKYWDWF